jgi:aldehyde dehydrogenase (NAD(P)+)
MERDLAAPEEARSPAAARPRPAPRLAAFAEAAFVPRVPSPAPTGERDLDRAVARVAEGARRWAGEGLPARIELLDALRRGYARVAAASVAAGCRAKGIEPGTPLEGEEWASGPATVLRLLRLLRTSLAALGAGDAVPTGPIGRTIDGRLAVGLFPRDGVDRLLLRGARVEVHCLPGLTAGRLAAACGGFPRHPDHHGRVALVLGGGNIASIPATDVLTKLFNEGKACVLKMNPVNAYLGPFLEEAFAEAVRRGCLAVVYGGAETGAHLCAHPGIDEIHVTGSDKTHDRIVWGPPGPAREARRARGEPLLEKPITAELGNVSPVLLVPGPWTPAQLRAQARDVAGYATMNASFLCNAAKVLVTPRGWAGRERFLGYLAEELARVPPRLAYYPGAPERWELLTAGRERLQTFGRAGDGRLPWALLAGLDPAAADEPLFVEETFCPILAETAVGSPDPRDFLEAAVAFANDRLWGTLSASLLVPPGGFAGPAAAAVEEAIVRLRYGTVAVNAFPGVSYALASPPWGGYPGATLADIQSGRGFVHNSALLAGIEKAVLRHPAAAWPPPPYVPGRRAFRGMMRRLAAYEAEPSFAKVPGLVLAALGG